MHSPRMKWGFGAGSMVGLGFATLLFELLRAHADPSAGGRVPISFFVAVGMISFGIAMAKAHARQKDEGSATGPEGGLLETPDAGGAEAAPQSEDAKVRLRHVADDGPPESVDDQDRRPPPSPLQAKAVRFLSEQPFAGLYGTEPTAVSGGQDYVEFHFAHRDGASKGRVRIRLRSGDCSWIGDAK